MPVYHSLEQVEEFKRYIDSLVKIESNSRSSYVTLQRPITQKRQKEIWRWIENEQALCGLDSGYFESRYAYVCDEKGQIFKFQNRLSQKIFDGVIAGFDEKQVSIELMILKARQVGVTTKTALKFLHRLLFVPHTQAVMASVQSDKSELIGRILDTAYNRCPWWLVPRRLPKGAYDNGSVLSIQSGMQATGIAQGWTPTCIHVCLGPETLIHVENGGVKPIIEVEPGDLVITSTGRQAKVKAVAQSPRTNEVASEISLWGSHRSAGALFCISHVKRGGHDAGFCQPEQHHSDSEEAAGVYLLKIQGRRLARPRAEVAGVLPRLRGGGDSRVARARQTRHG